MCRWELVEGRDRPKELGSPDFHRGPGTLAMALMCRITKPLWETDNTVVFKVVHVC